MCNNVFERKLKFLCSNQKCLIGILIFFQRVVPRSMPPSPSILVFDKVLRDVTPPRPLYRTPYSHNRDLVKRHGYQFQVRLSRGFVILYSSLFMINPLDFVTSINQRYLLGLRRIIVPQL